MEKSRRKILMGIDALSFSGCMYLYEGSGGVNVCVYGESLYSGCKGDCGYASVPNYGILALAGSYTFTGTVVHVHTGLSASSVAVSVTLPTRVRYTTVTDSKGNFKITTKHDRRAGRKPAFHVSHDFARMETAPYSKHIALVGDFTRAFRRAHPKLKFIDLKVSRFDGKTVHVGGRRRRV